MADVAQAPPRCPAAIRFGSLGTRCLLADGHRGDHEAAGRAESRYQVISWERGHRWEIETDRDDRYAWELA